MKILKKLLSKRSFLIFTIFIVIFLMLSAAFYLVHIRVRGMSNFEKKTSVVECVEGVKIKQTLTIPSAADRMRLTFKTHQQAMKGQLKVKLVHYPENHLIQEWSIINEKILNNQFYELVLKDDFYRGSKDNKYAIIIEGDSLCKLGSAPEIWYSLTDSYLNGDLYINGDKSEGDLCFEVYYESPELSKIFILFSIILCLLLIISNYMINILGCSIEKVFVVFVLLLGLVYMIIFPAESAPDEDRHIISAYNMSNVLLGGPEAEDALVYFRDEDLSGLYGERPNAQTYISMYNNFFSDSQREDYELVTKDFVIQTPFWTYLPQAIGISLGRVLNCNGTITILLGRLFSLLFFVCVTYFSIKIIPIGKMIFFAISLLPMTLELVSSYSYDGMVMALAFLFIALMCRLIFEKETLSIKHIIVPTIVFSLLAPNKYVYIPLIMLSLLLPSKKYKTNKEKWISVGIIFGGMIIALLFLRGRQHVVAQGFASVEYRTIDYCFHNVIEIIWVYLYTMLKNTAYYLTTMVGMSLGWLEIKMPYEIFALIILNLFLSTINKDTDRKVLVRNRHYFTFFMCAVCVIFMVLAAMLLTWTPKQYMFVEGVQGRYFLPVLPLLLLCVQKLDIRSPRNMLAPVAYIGFFINVVCIWNVFVIVASR